MITIIEESRIQFPSGKFGIRAKYECSKCRKHSWTSKYNLSRKKTAICKGCSNKISGLKKRGKPNPNLGYSQPKGENSPKWKGGRYTNKQGYVMVLSQEYSKDSNGWGRYRPEHILVAEKELGRNLTNQECVHHIDGDRANNSIDNLAVIPTNEHHRKAHFSLQKIGYELVKMGKIEFDKERGIYVLV